MYQMAYASQFGTMPYGQDMTTIPGANDDWNGTATDGEQCWCDGSLWQYRDASTGKITMYMCLRSDPGAALWVPIATQP